MASYLMRFGNRLVKFGDDNNDNGQDVEMYEEACKESKKGLALVMEGLDQGDADTIEMGAARAWEGIKTMKRLSDKMKRQFGSRRGYVGMRGGYGNSGNHGDFVNRMDGYDNQDWNKRDEDMMDRRMRDAMGRFM